MPVLSWLLLRGRCRDCGAPISARYPLVEAAHRASLFAAVALARGVDADLLLELPFAAMLIAVAAIDLEHRIVPNKILLPAAVCGVAAGARRCDPASCPSCSSPAPRRFRVPAGRRARPTRRAWAWAT